MRSFALSALLILSLGAGAPRAAVSVATESGVQISVEPSGHFEIRTAQPAFTFGGDVGRPLVNLRQGSGRDGIGEYVEVAFEALSAGAIRAYKTESIVLFTTEYRATTTTPDPFPTLKTYPKLPYSLSYRTLPFAPYQFNSLDNAADSPWFFFDDQGNGFVFGPATSFPVARSTIGTGGVLSSSIAPVGAIPNGLSHAVMLVTASGVNRLFDTWGNAMLRGYQKTRPRSDADLTLEKLGYWTDNGATYYYNFEPALGYQQTLLAVRQEFASKSIPLGYLQLDSWFYPKGPNARWDDRLGGIYRYVAAPELFPDGLKTFQAQLGLPLVTHARWIDQSSPLRAEFVTSGNVVTDQRYWNEVMAYLKASGVVTYEQDWLGNEAQPVYDLAAPGQFLGNMSAAAAQHQMTLQYCIPLPRHVLQTLLYPNVTTMRVSYDRFDSSHWDEFLYDARLASAVGVWPFTDVFMSGERSNLVIATLSAGIVGVGDALGTVDVGNLRHVIRADGTIVKPDLPLVPTDATFLAEAAGGPRGPMVASTFSDHGGLRTAYVFAYARGASAQEASFSAAELGVAGAAYVYDVFGDRGQLLAPGERFNALVSGDGALFVVAPVGPSGIALLGDAGLYASMGRKRISQLSDDGRVQLAVEFAAGETEVVLHGYAPKAPLLNGVPDGVDYDPETQRFSAVVHPGPAGFSLQLDGVESGAEA